MDGNQFHRFTLFDYFLDPTLNCAVLIMVTKIFILLSFGI